MIYLVISLVINILISLVIIYVMLKRKIPRTEFVNNYYLILFCLLLITVIPLELIRISFKIPNYIIFEIPILVFVFLFFTLTNNLTLIKLADFVYKSLHGYTLHSYVIDTNVLVDNRFIELLKSGLVSGEIIIPGFVIDEIVYMADHKNQEKRERGKIALKNINKIIELSKGVGNYVLRIKKIKSPSLKNIPNDQKLITYTKMINGILITEDTNLYELAKARDVKCVLFSEVVSNINPPIYIDDIIIVKPLRKGEKNNQLVGFYSDNSMVVVNFNKSNDIEQYIGKNVKAKVKYILSKPNNRIIFTEYQDILDYNFEYEE